MSPVRDIVAFAVKTYVKHFSTPEVSTLLNADASLDAESAKDFMIETLSNLQSLLNEEMTQRSTSLKRRRNQEHSRIYQLPNEIFVEIMLAAASSFLNVTDTFTLMRVSKYWFDTVAQCPHIWSRLNVDTRPQPGVLTMMRTLRGPVEVQCNQEPELGLDGPLAYLSTLDPPRLRALVWNWSDKTEALHSFFRARNSNIMDLTVDRLRSYSAQGRLDLSAEGIDLRHLDLRRVTLPWTSSRLSGLRTLSIEEIHYDQPSVHDLYRIISSSPALRHIRIQHFHEASQEQLDGSCGITEPIFLLELLSLQLVWIPPIIINTLVPLIRSPPFQCLELRPQSREPLQPLQPSNTIVDLMIGPITSQSTLDILVEDNAGDLSVSLFSLQTRGNTRVDWDNHNNGVSIKLFPSTVESLRNLFDGLIPRLQAAGWKPEGLDLSFDLSEDTACHEQVPALLCSFPLIFQTITQLDLALPSPSAYCSALYLLGDGIPQLTSLIMYRPSFGSSGRQEWVNGIKSFLERRYPLRPQPSPGVRHTVTQLARMCVPKEIAERLRCEWPATSLSMEKVLGSRYSGHTPGSHGGH